MYREKVEELKFSKQVVYCEGTGEETNGLSLWQEL